jgi:SAM-dependent methyltransferase
MRPLDTYLDLCTQYYDLDKPTPPVDALKFYTSFAHAANGAILEPMCGSGRYLIPLMEAGLDIEGFDASPQMLTALKHHAASKNLYPKIKEGFVQNLEVKDAFALAFIPSGSFNLITEMNDVITSLQRIYESLKRGGIFVFEFITMSEAKATSHNVWETSHVVRSDGKRIVNNSINFPLENNIGHATCRYELMDQDQILKTETETYYLRFYEMTELESLLKNAGFSNLNIHKAFERNHPPHPDDPTVVIECQKV